MVYHMFSNLPSKEFDGLTIRILIFSHRNLMVYYSFSNLPSEESGGFFHGDSDLFS